MLYDLGWFLTQMNSEQKIQLIQGLVDDLNDLPHRDEEKLDALRRRADMIVRRVFEDTSEYRDSLRRVNFYPMVAPADEEFHEYSWQSGKSSMLNILNTMLEDLKLFDSGDSTNDAESPKAPSSNQIFIVHGHDEAMKQDVARTLMTLDLKPLILHEKPDKGRTVIEKFSDYSSVSFAVVLLSPDDLARARNEASDLLKPRARQNVVFELGFFIGKLGRENVLSLYRAETEFEMPSDYSGVLYTPYDVSGSWRFKLVQELKSSGYEIDANKLIES